MNELLPLLLVCVAGIALGILFYGGLWWTIRQSLTSARPALWIFFSLLARMGVALAGFYFVAGSHWERLLVCMLGFMLARGGVTWVTRLKGFARADFNNANIKQADSNKADIKQSSSTKKIVVNAAPEVSHAP